LGRSFREAGCGHPSSDAALITFHQGSPDADLLLRPLVWRGHSIQVGSPRRRLPRSGQQIPTPPREVGDGKLPQLPKFLAVKAILYPPHGEPPRVCPVPCASPPDVVHPALPDHFPFISSSPVIDLTLWWSLPPPSYRRSQLAGRLPTQAVGNPPDLPAPSDEVTGSGGSTPHPGSQPPGRPGLPGTPRIWAPSRKNRRCRPPWPQPRGRAGRGMGVWLDYQGRDMGQVVTFQVIYPVPSRRTVASPRLMRCRRRGTGRPGERHQGTENSPTLLRRRTSATPPPGCAEILDNPPQPRPDLRRTSIDVLVSSNTTSHWRRGNPSGSGDCHVWSASLKVWEAERGVVIDVPRVPFEPRSERPEVPVL